MKKVCFPVVTNEGLSSAVYNHFGSAPEFIVVDTESMSVQTLQNQDLHHAHGSCNPMKALGNNRVDAVVVGGIGAGAIRGLNQLGVRVYKSQAKTVQENLNLLLQGKLTEMSMSDVCSSHSHIHLGGHDCCSHGGHGHKGGVGKSL